jgi:HAD superfamily hydrolase (TIGR01509 family)
MAIEAIIFDMDGLLVDSEPTWDKARARMAQRVGKEWTQQDHINVMGVSTDEWGRYMIKRLELASNLEEVQSEIIREMVAMYQQEIPYKPSAVEAVKWAAARFPTALASGSHPRLIEFVVQSPELQGCFDVIVPADEVGVGKPDPTIYLETARRLGIAPEKCLCLEDSLQGVLAGRRAKMFVINIPDPKFPLPEEQRAAADLILNSLGELSDQVIARLEAMR